MWMRAKRAAYCVAKNATLRAARPDPSLRKKTLARDDNRLGIFNPGQRPG